MKRRLIGEPTNDDDKSPDEPATKRARLNQASQDVESRLNTLRSDLAMLVNTEFLKFDDDCPILASMLRSNALSAMKSISLMHKRMQLFNKTAAFVAAKNTPSQSHYRPGRTPLSDP